MQTSTLIFYLFYLLSNLFILCAQGVSIRLYQHDEDYPRLVWESNSEKGCKNVPADKLGYTYSIRSDTCFIAYNYRNCMPVRTEKHLPGDIILSSTELGRNDFINSIQTCNEEETSNQLNVDLTKSKNSHLSPEVLERFKKVCSCVNVPQYVQNMSQWSIDNHHKSLYAYYEPDCSVNKWSPKFIKGGHNPESRSMHSHEKTDPVTKTTYKIQSFGPDPDSFQTLNCILEIMTTKNVEMQTQADNFRSEMLKNQDDIKKLSDKFTALEQQCRNVTQKIKSDLNQIFA